MSDVFNHPWLCGLFGDPEVQALWSPTEQIAHYTAFEVALSHALEDVGRVPQGHGAAAAATLEASIIDPASLAGDVARDGIPIPALVRRWRAADPAHKDAIHAGATSQDVMDTALALTLQAVSDLLTRRLRNLDASLWDLDARFGDRLLMGRTRMQAALWIQIADRLRSWRVPLAAHADRLDAARAGVERLQLGGAVGTRHSFGDQGQAIANTMAARLRLSAPDHAWHNERGGIVHYAACLAGLSGALGKMGQDIVLMAQQGLDDIRIAGGGGSSAMPHKSNPVLAELLVTLARLNAGSLSGMHHALIHEQERSGAAWMLEWALLPQMTLATGRAITAAHALCDGIEDMGAA
ncbi:3-carboxy-cis,cis-muconate cycloisomerase (plasmid) [Sulfitobacter faviae]|uniref:3-carboxy-cis,cis-muconate cycloisomerase n=1 Tax=Sulfitobacter faviae TaxID=1775881 RepID=A0ABZ0V579_9RHOB|nr:3-carboxy-cis,cis-muconate cycloisomerase [Sulfitobacter faviae]WPZ23913.1 3-carboxy-cis,cis-muconate cycloisomerase [Sulfitobacter faviae]